MFFEQMNKGRINVMKIGSDNHFPGNYNNIVSAGNIFLINPITFADKTFGAVSDNCAAKLLTYGDTKPACPVF